jgi:hypothetical protein
MTTVFFITSCKKNKTHYEEGTILWTGDVAVDGCGWLIESREQLFHPLNLTSEFQQDSLKVLVDLRYANESFSCGVMPTTYPSVEIKNIKKK